MRKDDRVDTPPPRLTAKQKRLKPLEFQVTSRIICIYIAVLLSVIDAVLFMMHKPCHLLSLNPACPQITVPFIPRPFPHHHHPPDHIVFSVTMLPCSDSLSTGTQVDQPVLVTDSKSAHYHRLGIVCQVVPHMVSGAHTVEGYYMCRLYSEKEKRSTIKMLPSQLEKYHCDSVSAAACLTVSPFCYHLSPPINYPIALSDYPSTDTHAAHCTSTTTLTTCTA